MDMHTPIHMQILTVTVTTDASGNPTIDVTPHDLEMDKNKDVKLVWHLLTPGWIFKDDGIVIPNDPEQEFVDLQVVSDGQGYYCLNKNNKKKTYQYWVTVHPNGIVGATAIRKDPTIQNQDT